jgi:hypothetical protein
MSESLLDGMAKAICCPKGCEATGARRDDCLGYVSICQAPSYAAAANAALAYLAAQGYTLTKLVVTRGVPKQYDEEETR